MILLRLLSWPYVRKHALRSLLTVAGIAIGVAVFVAMHAANRAVLDSFRETVNRIAGAADLQVSAGEPGFDEDVLARVQSLSQVRVAAPIIESVVGTGLSGQGNLLILGVDMTGDRSLREYDLESGDAAMIDDPLVFLAQPDSLMVSSDFARRNGLRTGSRVPLETIDGTRVFTVRGILRSSGRNAAFGGNMAVMDIYAAQHVFGRGRKFDRIDLAVAAGVPVADAHAALRNLLGPGFQVQPPASRGQSFQSILRVYSFMLSFSSMFALVVGMFIIYNSFSIAVTPHAALTVAQALRPVLRWLRPVEGTLAADSLIGAPRRTSATVAALMLSIALVIGLGGTARASYRNITEWVTEALNPDFFVSSSTTLTSRSYRFPASMAEELAEVDGIDEVQKYRSARIEYQGETVLLIAPELAKYGARSRRHAVAGDLGEMFRLAGSGQGVIASENFAALRKVRLGDSIEIPAPTGPLRLPVVGIVREYADQQGALIVDRAVYTRHWNDDSVDLFRVYLEKGANPDAVRAAILNRFAGNRRLFVLTNAEVRRYVLRLTDQWFGMTWIQIAVAILVAVLGIVNSLTVSIADRRRELGVLQALGGLRGQIRGTLWMESLGTAAVSLVLGAGLGAIHLYFVLELSYRDFPGMRFDYTYPFGVVAALVPMLLTAALAAALGPAESAVRGSLVEALEYE